MSCEKDILGSKGTKEMSSRMWLPAARTIIKNIVDSGRSFNTNCVRLKRGNRLPLRIAAKLIAFNYLLGKRTMAANFNVNNNFYSNKIHKNFTVRDSIFV